MISSTFSPRCPPAASCSNCCLVGPSHMFAMGQKYGALRGGANNTAGRCCRRPRRGGRALCDVTKAAGLCGKPGKREAGKRSSRDRHEVSSFHLGGGASFFPDHQQKRISLLSFLHRPGLRSTEGFKICIQGIVTHRRVRLTLVFSSPSADGHSLTLQ